MSLKPGYSRGTVEHNIAEMVNGTSGPSGKKYPRNQAVAAALEHARESYFKRFPHGTLPVYLKLPNGRRDRAAWDKYRKNPADCGCGPRRKNPILRHRYEVQYIDNWGGIERQGFDTVREARAFADSKGDMLLEVFDTVQKKALYRAKQRRTNPVPESSRSTRHSREARVKAAADLYERFTGHEADEAVTIDKPDFPDVVLVVGDIDFVGYTTVRDGVTEKYIHKFKKDCRPLFAVSHDGKQLFMLGGSYDFTERGIVDRSIS